MKIAILNMFFSSPQGKWSTRVYDISKYLVDKGHDVNIITAKFYKSDLKSNKFIDVINIDGINVHLINIENNNKQNLIKRIINFLCFSLIAQFKVFSISADKFIFSSGPITVFLNAFIYSLIFPKKTYLEVRDLWPEGIEELEIIKSKTIISILKRFVKLVYRRSQEIIVLSKGMKDYIIENYSISQSNITVATNFADFEFIEKNLLKSTKLEIPNKYFLYYGNLGYVNDVINIAKLFKNYDKENDPHILFLGDGQLKDELYELSNKFHNIHFFESIEKSDLIPIISNSIACFVPLQKGLIMGTSSPNKLFESLGCGAIVLHNTDGWIKEMVELNNFGFYFDLSDKLSLNKLITDLNSKKIKYDKKMIKAKSKLLFSKDVICEIIYNTINKN